jgi:hypothetical protein
MKGEEDHKPKDRDDSLIRPGLKKVRIDNEKQRIWVAKVPVRCKLCFFPSSASQINIYM